MRRPFLLFPVFALLVFAGLPASAQSSGKGSSQTVSPNILPDVQDTSEFPQWARDLRRGEIVAFGVFPFTMFASTFAMESMRYFQHDMDGAYLPWPFKGPGAIEMSREEREQSLVAAAIASVTIAAIDFTIVQVKRYREKRRIEAQERNKGIRIIRSAIAEDEPLPEDLREGPEGSEGESPQGEGEGILEGSP
jgi:hypothetical protein